MDVKKLGGCLHKLGVKYDRPLFELATKAFDEDQSGLIEFDEFVEMFATLRASDELALGDFGAPSAELTAQELSDVKASFDAIDADGSRTDLTINGSRFECVPTVARGWGPACLRVLSFAPGAGTMCAVDVHFVRSERDLRMQSALLLV